jgi:acyl-CoA reductase-like NAD-dependent aldehyde dehydrogenase
MTKTPVQRLREMAATAAARAEIMRRFADQFVDKADPYWQVAENDATVEEANAADLHAAASRAEELERALGELGDDLERMAQECDQLRPDALDGPRYHRLEGKAQAYRHAAEFARQALSDKG